MKTSQSLSVPQSLDCTHKRESATPTAKKKVKVKWKLLSHYQYPSCWLHARENRLLPPQTTVKVKWKLLSQYQYPSHLIAHRRENRLFPPPTTVKVKWKLLSHYQYPSHLIAHTRENRLPTVQTTVKVKWNLLSQYQYLSHMIAGCHVSIRIQTPPPLWPQKHTDVRAHDSVHSPDLWHQPSFVNSTQVWHRRVTGLPLIDMGHKRPVNEGLSASGPIRSRTQSQSIWHRRVCGINPDIP